MNKLALTLCLALAACGRPTIAQRSGPLPQFDVAGILIPTEQIGVPPFVVQQRIKGTYQGSEVTVDCVVQFQDKKLTVLGLTPFGTRAFSIEQTGTQVKFEKYVERDMPVQPEMVLYDVHRVFFRGLPPGQHAGQDHGDAVTEVWSGDHIKERRFISTEGPSNMVLVTFDGPPAPIVAATVHITNTAFGYSLDIENTQQQALAPTYTLAVEKVEGAPERPAELPPGELPPEETPSVPFDPRLSIPPSAD